jgi:hypothetical protein
MSCPVSDLSVSHSATGRRGQHVPSTVIRMVPSPAPFHSAGADAACRAPLPSSPPGLTRWSMLTCSESSNVANLNKPTPRMDCRVKPGNDDKESRSRDARAPELCLPPRTEKDSPPATKREAKRRKAHANHVRAHRRTSPPADASSAAARHYRGCARLPALHRGTRHRLLPRWLSPRTGFPQGTAHRCFARSPHDALS